MKTIVEAMEDLAAGRESARSLMEGCLEAALAKDGEGERVFIDLDVAAARAAADATDVLRKVGRAPSPIAGIPVSVKDLFDVAGEVTRAGSMLRREAPPADRDAVAVARLKAAGLIQVGRTNMSEFAFSGIGMNPHYGTPRNPFDRETGRIPGGSTSGGAVSVSDGMALAALLERIPGDPAVFRRRFAASSATSRRPGVFRRRVLFRCRARSIPLDLSPRALPVAPGLMPFWRERRRSFRSLWGHAGFVCWRRSMSCVMIWTTGSPRPSIVRLADCRQRVR